jgi:hypothetical protein
MVRSLAKEIESAAEALKKDNYTNEAEIKF